MKFRLLAMAACLLAAASVASAQTEPTWYQNKKHKGEFFANLQGGFSYSLNENLRGCISSGNGGDMFQGQGSASFGYYFIPRLGVRLSGEFSRNGSCANYDESYAKYRPYYFNSVSAFADLIVNGGDVSKPKNFNWRFFGGVGWAYSYDFTETCFKAVKTPQEDYYITSPNNSFAFRFGFMLEYVFDCGVGVHFEGSHEWMTDWFNGFNNARIGGFPFDMRLNNSLGVSYHF